MPKQSAGEQGFPARGGTNPAFSGANIPGKYPHTNQFAGEQGFEPRLTIPETVVLPLDDSPKAL